MSQTIRGARHLAGLGVLLLAGLVALETLGDDGAREATIAHYATLAEYLVGTLAGVLLGYSARNWPTANRAPTSAELDAERPRMDAP